SEEPTQTVQADPDKRWLISAPLEVRKSNSSGGEHTLDGSGIGSTTNGSGRRQYSWETRGTLELHTSLMPKLLTFLGKLYLSFSNPNLRFDSDFSWEGPIGL
ncbi:unnamed protein product, partial [Schistosoma curassoni]|uniref:Hexon n=1 Tax=Schistosoma curassoni TaxID=6186 RepID=A0A183JQR2_9TREM